MAVTANQKITARNQRSRVGVPVASSKHIYQGTMAFIASGYLTDVSGATGTNQLAGIVIDEKDNSSGSNGDLTAEVYEEGSFLLTGSGFAQSDVGSKVYASDNYTITKTSTNNSPVGRIDEFVSSTQVMVQIDKQQM